MRLICGNFAGNNQKGFGAVALLMIACVILALSIDGYSWFISNEVGVTKLLISLKVITKPVLREYKSPDKWGFSFEYPQSMAVESKDDGAEGYLVVVKDGDVIKSSVSVAKTGFLIGGIGADLRSKEVFNNISWTYSETTKWCDAGKCGVIDSSYEVVKNKVLYRVVATTKDNDMVVTKQILNSWSFR